MKQPVVQRVDHPSGTRTPTQPVREHAVQLAEFETTSKSMEQAAVDADCEVAARCIDELLTEAASPPDHTEASVNVAAIRHPSGDALEHILQQSAYASVRNIKARIERNVVVLQGDVPTFYLRQIALAAAMKHLPGTFIVDFIKVSYA